ncbi:MAG: hypothetical protein KGL35_17965 [Bradyrhizobium sp.]|nr:hypothetical protein [Bradyrhizobium sp.]
MQVSLDQEASFLHSNRVEAIIRPLISYVVSFFIAIMGDDKTLGLFHQGGATFTTYVAINYMFDSASFLAAYSLATALLSPFSSWLFLLTVAVIAQIAPMVGRMGNVFLAGGFFWQLFLLTSKRYVAAVVCGVVICFMRTDVVFASAFAVPTAAWFERRWPSSKEWGAFVFLIGSSVLIPKALILHNPNPDYVSFLLMQGDYFSKLLGNIHATKLAFGLACPMLAVILVSKNRLTKATAIIIPAGLIYLGMVFVVADFTETRLLGPPLGALALVFSEIIGRRLRDEYADVLTQSAEPTSWPPTEE